MKTLENKEVFSKNLKYYMDKHNISRMDLVERLDLKYMTLSDWINAKTYPRIDKIELLADYFGINKSDLIEDKIDATTKPYPTLSQQEQYLLDNFNSTTIKGKNRIITTSEEMVELYPIIPSREEMLEYFKGMQMASLDGRGLNSMSDEEIYQRYKLIKETLDEK